MRSEIGSEFWTVPTVESANLVIPEHAQWFLSGRIALKYIIEDIKSKIEVRTVALPSWCCDSMIKPFADAGITVKFYPALLPIQGIEADAVLVMDYFGYTGHSEIQDYKGIIIRDVTHSIFSASYDDAHYYFGSLRKWAGFWTGGYAWGTMSGILNTDDSYVALRKAAMEAKQAYMDGISNNKDYLKTFNEAEEYLEGCAIAAGDARDVELANFLDVNHIKEQRRKNARVLLEAFSDKAVFPIFKENDCPMFVPILVPDGKRNELRRYLIEHEIYCPVHWPVTAYHELDTAARKIYAEELSLVCDQRYTEADMQRLVATIEEF